jgi:hypothetical protein
MIFEFFDGVHVPVSVRADALPVPASGSGRRPEFVNECLCGAEVPDDAVAPEWDNADRHHIDPVWQADIAHPFDLPSELGLLT